MKNLSIVTLDFETFYGKDYSLTSQHLNTSQYIRNPLFKAHCVGIKVDDAPTQCYAGADIAKAIKAIDWKKSALVAQNTAFDGLILSHHYGVIPAFYYDTLSMAKALHAEISRSNLDTLARFYGVGEKSKTYLTPTYGKRDLDARTLKGLMDGCILDVDLTRAIFDKQLEVFPEDELRLIDLTMRLFCDPILQLDEERCRKAHTWEVEERIRAILYSGVTSTVLNSADKFAEALYDLGVDPPTKISKTTGKETYAFSRTDQDFTALLQHEDIGVVRLVSGRFAAKSKLNETRAERLLKDGADGQAVPVMLNYCGAKTTRWSGGNKLNLQNLERIQRDAEGVPVPNTGELRQSLIAPPGHVIVVCDSAQIEARVLAWLAGQDDIVEAFAKKLDIYSLMASGIYGYEVDKKKHPTARFVGKCATLGLGYGMGHKKFQTTLALGVLGPPVTLSAQECQDIVNKYRANNFHITALWKTADGVLRSMIAGQEGTFCDLLDYDSEAIWLPSGLPLNYPKLKMTIGEDGYAGDISYLSNEKRTKIYGSLFVENLVQGLSRVVVGEQMLWINDELSKLRLRRGERARVVLMTHDEVVSVVPERYAEKVKDMKLALMRTRPSWCADLPLDAEAGYSREYSK